MDIRLNPILSPYPDVETAKLVADSLNISYQLVRYAEQTVVWIIPIPDAQHGV